LSDSTESLSDLVCQHCGKQFRRPSSLFVHVCEPKKRFQEKNEKGVQLGMQAYLRFYEVTQGSAKTKTFEDFVRSPYYRAFVKFGRHIVAINAINPSRFIDWVIKQNKKIDFWCQEKVYNEYLTQYLQSEAVSDALERAVNYSIKWSEETGSQPHDILRCGNTNKLCFAVQTGRISAWVLYASASGQDFIGSLNQDQLKIVWPQINPEFWQHKFKDYAADYLYAQEILKQAEW